MNCLILEDSPDRANDMIDVCQKLGIAVGHAECYQAARLCIRDHRTKYDVILLDHLVPRYGGSSAEPIGYGLQRDIRQFQPSAVVIGTSSFSAEEITKMGFAMPPHSMNKRYAEKELTPLLQRLMGA